MTITDMLRPGERFTVGRTFTATAPGPVLSVGLTVSLRDPAGAIIPVTLGAVTYGTVVVNTVTLGTASAAGNYTIPKTNASRGVWWYIWEAAGDLVAADETPFLVGLSRFLS